MKKIFVIETKQEIADWTGWIPFVGFATKEEAIKAQRYWNKVEECKVYEFTVYKDKKEFKNDMEGDLK
jgi:hypothetical protein